MTTRQIIKEVINQSLGFISRLEIKNEFQLFERSEPTPYARCFIIFIRALCKDTNWIEQKRAIYYSRSRQSEWRKGDSSGHIQKLKEIRADCDTDCILLLVDQVGAACHENTRSCFTKQISKTAITLNAETAYPALFSESNK